MRSTCDAGTTLHESIQSGVQSSVPFKVIDLLTLEWPTFNPSANSMDYEKGLMNAFKRFFPKAVLYGPFLHFVQDIKKQVAARCLSKKYRDEPDFALKAKMIPTLALLPPTLPEDAAMQLRSDLPPELELIGLFDDGIPRFPSKCGQFSNARAKANRGQIWAPKQPRRACRVSSE